MRNWALFFFGLLLLIIIGCGGGGGGGTTGTNATNGGTTGGLANIVVVFYDDNNTELARSNPTDSNGDFAVSVATEARYFQVLAGSIDLNTHYRFYSYAGKGYSPLSADCATPLPTLINGSDISLPGGDIRIPKRSGPPPPPPDGCFAPPIGSGGGGFATVRGHVIEY